MNVADIKAQVAANEKGVQELRTRRRAVRLADGQRLYAPRHGQRRGSRPPRDRPDRRRAASTTRWTTAATAVRRDQRRPRNPQRHRGFHRHRPAARGQLQLAARGHPRGGAVRVPLPGRRRHPAERRLPEAADPDHPARHVPVARTRRRRGRRQHRGVAGHLQRPVRRARRRSPAPRRR